MSESAENLEQQGVAEQEQEQHEQQEQQAQRESPKVNFEEIESKKQDRASALGWKDYDRHIETGGKPEDWQTAGEFLIAHKFIAERDGWKQGYEARADRLEKFYKAQMETQRKELEAKLDEAIESGDASAIKRANTNLREHDKLESETATQQQHDPVLSEWNAKNASWINDPEDPKAVYAHTHWPSILQRHGNSASALAELERKLATKFPPPKQEKGHVPGAESGKHKGFQKRTRQVTWDDLTADEVKYYRAFPDAWKSKDEYLKAVRDAREQEEKN